eukprot:GHVU01095381.1.p1 GENE.GHVU01095381.1~~GHVU01095381.1.p1  ORF type:complete len:150 (+),score=14.33 GHVU01095381.1:131-580(+)
MSAREDDVANSYQEHERRTAKEGTAWREDEEKGWVSPEEPNPRKADPTQLCQSGWAHLALTIDTHIAAIAAALLPTDRLTDCRVGPTDRTDGYWKQTRRCPHSSSQPDSQTDRQTDTCVCMAAVQQHGRGNGWVAMRIRLTEVIALPSY